MQPSAKVATQLSVASSQRSVVQLSASSQLRALPVQAPEPSQ